MEVAPLRSGYVLNSDNLYRMDIVFYYPSREIPAEFSKVQIQPVVDKDYFYQPAQPIKINFAYDLRSIDLLPNRVSEMPGLQ